MSKWLNLFLENEIANRSDKSDRFDLRVSLSGGPHELLDEKKVKNNHSKRGDKSARFRFETNMSPLSGSPRGILEENLGNMPSVLSDKSDNWNSNLISSFYDDYQERLAIAEVDGNQNPRQAHRIAYLDAFISLLSDLPEEGPHQDWLTQKIQTALAILQTKNFRVLN